MVHVGDRLVTVDNQQRGDADAMRHALATRARIVLRFRQRRLGARGQDIFQSQRRGDVDELRV